MNDNLENIILEHLRAVRSKLDTLENEIGDVKLRLSAIESHGATAHMEVAGQNKRLDRIDERIGRIEKRLDLVEA